MTPIADMVEQMLSTGIPPEAIVLAIRTAELTARGNGDPVAERRRAWDRERKRNSTGNSAETHIEDSKIDTKKESKKVSSMRGSRIPPDFAPSAEAAKAEGLTEIDIARESARFRDYWTSKAGSAGVKLDWAATWRNWCRTAAEKRGRSPPAPLNGQKSIFVREGTPQWEAWCKHLGKPPPMKNFGWHFATEWPPNGSN